jgi:uncharacterized protein YndB with AHSA1/START domain
VAETPSATERVEHTVRVDAPREAVFEYFTDPSKLSRWMGSQATLDPRPGGVCRFEINGSRMIGQYVQVDFPWRLVFTWGWETTMFEVGAQSTAVEVSFTPEGDGTVVRLTHTRLPEAAVAFHGAGWRHYLTRLAVAARGDDPGPDPWKDLTVVAKAVQAEVER